MSSDCLIRALRVTAVAILCSIGSTSSLWADPVIVTSGEFGFGRGPAHEAAFTFSGTDGFFLSAFAVPVAAVEPFCSPTGCRPGDILNMSVVGGEASGLTQVRFPPAFTLGVSSGGRGVTVNGTEIVRPGPETFPGPLGLTGSLRFDVTPVVLPSETEVADAPFVFNGHATGFAIQDVNARVPLFDVNLVGQGTAVVDFESGVIDGVFREPVFRFFFTAAPAATPEPATLALFGTGLVGLAARARQRRRR